MKIHLVFVYGLIGLSFCMAFLRLIIGPRFADRVLALELISIESIAIIAVYDMTTGLPRFLDVAVILALVSFLGTIAFTYYMHFRGQLK